MSSGQQFNYKENKYKTIAKTEKQMDLHIIVFISCVLEPDLKDLSDRISSMVKVSSLPIKKITSLFIHIEQILEIG